MISQDRVCRSPISRLARGRLPRFPSLARLAAFLLAGCASAAVAQERVVSVAGPSTASLDVREVRVGRGAGGEHVVLEGIELLGTLPSGTSPAHRARADRPRRDFVFGAVSAVRLPGAAGSWIVHYRRAGGRIFGFAHVREDGAFDALVERPGLGPSQTLDPFDPVVGVRRDGRRAAISAPTFSKGVGGLGDLWIVSLDGTPLFGGGTVVEISGPVVVDAPGTGLTWFGGDLWAVADDRLARAPGDGSGPFVPVALPGVGTGAEYVAEFVVSEDGGRMGVLAGADEEHLHLFVLDPSGAAQKVTETAAEIQPPGFLPEEPNGPFLALSADGSYAAYVAKVGPHREVFVEPTAPGNAPFQVTQDALFDTSIDNPSGLLSGGALAFRFFMDSGLQNADLYEILPATPGGPTVRNLTATSGAQTPFFPNAGTLSPRTSWTSGEEFWFAAIDSSGGQGFDLWRVDAMGNAQVAFSGLVAAPDVKAFSQDAQLLTLRGTAGDLLVLAGAALGGLGPSLPLPAGVVLGPAAVDAPRRRVGFVAGFAGQSFVAWWDIATGALGVAPGFPFQNARELAFTPGGALLFVHDAAGGAVRTFVEPSSGLSGQVGAPAPVAGWLR